MATFQLLRKSISDSMWLWLACAATLMSFCWVRVWITSTIDMTQFSKLVRHVPDFVQRMLPVPLEQLLSYPTRIAMTYEDPAVFLAIALWAITRGSDSVSGELGRGTLELLLAQPVSRLQILLTASMVTIVGAAFLVVAAWCGTYVGIATFSVHVRPTAWRIPLVDIDVPITRTPIGEEFIPMAELVDPNILWPALANLFAFSILLIGVSTFFSSLDRYRWRTIGITVGLYVVQMMLEIIGMAVESMQWMRRLTIFTAYEPVLIVSRAMQNSDYAWSWIYHDNAASTRILGPLAYDSILMGIGLVSLVAASIIFVRRDLPAPL